MITLPISLKKTLFVVTTAMIGIPSVYAQTGVDALPSRPASERVVKETSAASEVPTTKAKKVQPSSTSTSGEAIVRTALQYIGARYRSGQSGPKAFDCSGFTSFVYRRQSIPISRSSRTQFREGTPITSIRDLQKGDLVFFGGSSRSRTVGHVGIVTEVDAAANKFKFVHAARTGVQVDDSSSAYYSRRYIGARRIISD